jgi:hypothetical protein
MADMMVWRRTCASIFYSSHSSEEEKKKKKKEGEKSDDIESCTQDIFTLIIIIFIAHLKFQLERDKQCTYTQYTFKGKTKIA